MTRIDTDLYHLLCVMSGIGTVAVGVVLIMLVDELIDWIRG